MRPIDAEPLEEILRLRCAKDSNDYGLLAGAIGGCLKLVQAQPTIAPPPNEPLTLEELRQMDGEPVWDNSLKTWGIVVGEYLLYRNREMGKICGNNYYRRKPGEGTR